MRSSPCLGCQKKFIGCHSNCLEYIDFRQKLDVDNDERKRRKKLDGLVKYSDIPYAQRRKKTETQRKAYKARPERPSQKD